MSFPLYEEYKESGVEWLGYVPKHWNIKRLRFVAEFNPSKSEVAALDRSTEVSFLPMEAVGDDGSISLDQTRPVGDVESGYTYFREGDVTFAKITPCFENGKGAIMRGLVGGVGFGTTELIVARPHANQTTAFFLHWLFTSPTFRKLGEAFMYGAGGQKRVPDNFVRNFATAFPPLSEQSAIVALLDRETTKIDALVNEQKRLIDLLKEKRQAIISHAVTKGLHANVPTKHTGVEWIGHVPEHWALGQLRYIARRGTSITYGIVQAGPDVEGGIPYIRTSDMAGDYLPPEGYLRTSPEIDAAYARSKINAGDLVIAIRATIGKPLIVPQYLDGANLTQGTAKFSPGIGISAEYVCSFLRSTGAISEFERIAKGATFKEITLEMLRKFPVLRPPLLEQQEIVAFLERVTAKLDALINAAETATALLTERRNALISAAVTGKIDVRGLVPAKAEAA